MQQEMYVPAIFKIVKILLFSSTNITSISIRLKIQKSSIF
jgi:hypothetical protein